MEVYTGGKEIALWDEVTYAGAKATVVYVGFGNTENPKYPKADWETEVKNGILIEFENGAILQLNECDDDEDLVFKARGLE
jgi:hypothetical protein